MTHYRDSKPCGQRFLHGDHQEVTTHQEVINRLNNWLISPQGGRDIWRTKKHEHPGHSRCWFLAWFLVPTISNSVSGNTFNPIFSLSNLRQLRPWAWGAYSWRWKTTVRVVAYAVSLFVWSRAQLTCRTYVLKLFLPRRIYNPKHALTHIPPGHHGCPRESNVQCWSPKVFADALWGPNMY